MTNKMIIEIEPQSIQLTTVRDGVRSTKQTDLPSIQEVLTKDKTMETPLLPSQWGMQKYARNGDREMYVLTTAPHLRECRYVQTEETFQVPMPGFMWIIIARVQPGSDQRTYYHGMAYALKNQLLSEKDRLYRFPFANVDNRWMCWGDQPAPALGSAKSIMMVPDHFLSMEFNHHLDERKFEYFTGEIRGREVELTRTSHLLKYFDEQVKKGVAEGKRAEEVPFKYDILIRDKTVGEAIKYFKDEFLR